VNTRRPRWTIIRSLRFHMAESAGTSPSLSADGGESLATFVPVGSARASDKQASIARRLHGFS
jgi:hypothetical protein